MGLLDDYPDYGTWALENGLLEKPIHLLDCQLSHVVRGKPGQCQIIFILGTDPHEQKGFLGCLIATGNKEHITKEIERWGGWFQIMGKISPENKFVAGGVREVIPLVGTYAPMENIP